MEKKIFFIFGIRLSNSITKRHTKFQVQIRISRTSVWKGYKPQMCDAICPWAREGLAKLIPYPIPGIVGCNNVTTGPVPVRASYI